MAHQRHDAGLLRPAPVGLRRKQKKNFPLIQYQERRCFARTHVFILLSPLAEGQRGRRTHRACTAETACSRRAAAPDPGAPPDRAVAMLRTETPAQSWTAALEPMVAVYTRTGETDDGDCQPSQSFHLMCIQTTVNVTFTIKVLKTQNMNQHAKLSLTTKTDKTWSIPGLVPNPP